MPAPIALGLTNDERYANTHLLFSSIQTNGPTPEPGLGTPQRGRASLLRIRSTCWTIRVGAKGRVRPSVYHACHTQRISPTVGPLVLARKAGRDGAAGPSG